MTISDFGMPSSKIKKILSPFLFKLTSIILDSQLKYFPSSQPYLLFLLALFLLALLYYKFHYQSPQPPEEAYQEIVIELAGDIQKPGVYIFKRPPTLREAIEKAEGIKGEGLFEKDLPSETLATGTLLKVRKVSPQEIKIKIERMEANKLIVFSIPLDLNRVSLEDLCLIPGIGETLAREIIAYRKRRGGFLSVEELKKVKGIGDKKWKEFKPYLIVRSGERDGSL
ncbi:MAG: ComEA family DNA-binding protein [Thermodesulfobacteriota bacterium]